MFTIGIPFEMNGDLEEFSLWNFFLWPQYNNMCYHF